MVIYAETAQPIARELLRIEAIKLNILKPFTWSSGWKSPIYCDNRLALSYPHVRTMVKEGLVNAIRHNFPAVQAIAGVATAGIPQGALVADALDIPFVYVRPKPKDHGMENLIEGKITKNQKVVVLEDLVSTGGSSLKATEALRDAGFDVIGMAAVFTYGFDVAEAQFKKANVPLVCLSDYQHLVDYALSTNTITDEQLTQLKAWRYDPASWAV
ncbi:MAG: orotate phosphoribosyltransferase [Cyclobacteriaceae bacterium]|jgi:orotate phosphoribosyltransferase|nr:orotate phosphoribosyltransferase [Flammeovirgaceae bacterium]MCZ8021564.1 orotate phosphoribosyltransferase [Cytophagales bacterium]MCZ8327847.1 orotate phosphoribosyltransferase [Cyclobacteriaceae bacterium]